MPTIDLIAPSSVSNSNYGLNYTKVTLTKPDELRGATFNGVTISYTLNSAGTKRGARFTKSGAFYDKVTDVWLLEQLQTGAFDTSLEIWFTVDKDTSGSRAEASNIHFTVDYTPAADIAGTYDFDEGASVFYAIDKHSVAPQETANVTVYLTLSDAFPFPVNEFNVALFDTEDGGGAHLIFDEYVDVTPVLPGKKAEIHVPLDSGVWSRLTDRVSPAYISFSMFDSTDVTYPAVIGDIIQCGETMQFNLVKNRINPTISAAWSDTTVNKSYFGQYIEGKSFLRTVMTIGVDTDADASNTVVSRAVTLTNASQTIPFFAGNDTLDIGVLSNLTGLITWTISVTDSYNQVGTATGMFMILSYREPYATTFEAQRYSETATEGVYVLDDDSPLIWINLEGAISALNGKNGWQLICEYTNDMSESEVPSNAAISGEVTMASGTDGQVLNFTHDRSIFPVELSESSEWLLTLYIVDHYGTYLVKKCRIGKSGAIFNIEQTGVAIGKRSQGTAENPTFECAYEAHFLDNIYDKDGNKIGGTIYSTTPTPCGTWIDGSVIYRVVLTGITTTYGTHYIDLDFEVGTPIRIYGFAKQGTNWHPLNSYYTESWRWYCRLSTASQLVYVASNSFTDGMIVIEYIPAAEN